MPAVEWRARKLDDLGFVGRGKSRHRPRNEASLYGGKYPFFQTGDIKAANFHLTQYTQTYSEKGLAQSKLWQPGTLCITIAANIAETAILGIPGCFPDSVVGFIADPMEADTRFVKYYIDTLKLQMQSVSRGTTQDNLSVDKLLTFDFRVPPLPVQRRIAGILSAYDELMENCRRRIRILEEISRTLYREWFVEFRFPRRNGALAESPLGPIPKGWQVTTLREQLTALESGRRPKGGIRDVIDGVPSIGAENIDGIGSHDFASEKFVPREFFELMNRGVVRDRDVAIYKDGAYIGKSSYFRDGFPHAECCVNEHVFLLRAKGDRLTQNALYLWLQEPSTVHAIRATNANAAQPGINQQSVGGLELVVPDVGIASQFNQLVEPMLAALINHAKRIQNLGRTRDLLLPQLLSGRLSLDVSAVGDSTEPTAAASRFSQTDFASEEPALRAAEEAPPYRVARAGHRLSPPAEPVDEAPAPIDQIDRSEVLRVIRQVFGEGPPRERDGAIRDVARALGYRRTGPRIQEILHTDLMTAVRRCILENDNGALRLCASSITDYDRNFLKQQFLAAIGRTWIDRNTAIRNFCRWLGFARTGPIIEDTTRSLIKGLLRERRLEADAKMLRRV